jgi:immune inhibitor A
MSGGEYHISGDVIGWLQLPHSTWWYGTDQCPGRRSPYESGSRNNGAIPGAGDNRSLVRDALDAVNAISDTIPGFDWNNYDLDGDGIIDRLWIVHAGYGEEDGTVLLNRTDYGESAIWSHSSSLLPAYEVAEGIAAGPYIMMPENGGIGVFAHEAGHNLGANDLYAYDLGETSAGFWTLISDDWTGVPIGFEPPAVDPWHLDRWGWLDPAVISDTSQVYTVTLGQASRFPDEEGMYRGARIELEDGLLPLPVPVWQGDYYWWGGEEDLANAMMTTADPIAIPGAATTATLSFDLVYDIEDEWDFLWIQVSEDGVTWPYTDTLTNENTQCVHHPNWIGGLNGFPEDLCGAGIGGFYGYNANWPDPELQEFDLSAYAGKSIYLRFWFMTDWGTHYTGAFVDNVMVEADDVTLFEDDAESGDAKWEYMAPWQRNSGTQSFTHNFYLQWRNLNDESGYDSALGDPRWRFGPANTGLLVWYNNNFYSNNEIWRHRFDYPSVGPKGRMLVVDAHPEPYRDPDLVALGFDNEGGNTTSRGQMRDAPFTLADTVDFDYTDPYRDGAQEHSYEGRPAVSAFHDSMGYYPGAEYVRRGPAYPPTQFKWLTKQWDASAVVPAQSLYALKAMGYDGTTSNPSAGDREFRFNCAPYLSGPYAGYLGCYWLGSGVGLGYQGGTGNPGDDGLQYGWHVELIEEAADHTWATVRIWNAMKALDDDFTATPTSVRVGGQIDYSYKVNYNAGSPLAQGLVIIPLDTSKVEYVAGSAHGGLVTLPVGMSAAQVAALYAEGGQEALEAMAVGQAGPVGALAWVAGPLATGEGSLDAGFSVKAKVEGPYIVRPEAMAYDGAVGFQTTPATPVNVLENVRIYLPLIFKRYDRELHVTLLHTNDFHGNLETDYRGRGGSAYMASVIGDIRDEVGEDRVYLLDAGDVFLGAPPISQLLTGTSTIDIYNMLGYDVAAFGNHEFDKGQDALQDRITQSDFPWIGANIVVSGTDWTHPAWVEPYVVLSKDGVDLGIIGLDTDETPLVTLKGTTDGLEFTDLTEAVLHYYDEVMAQSDALIVLAHMGTEDSGGFKGLQTVAQELNAAGKPVDLMIAGHQHQALEEPVMVGDTAIIGAGYYGRWLGRADVSVDPETKSLNLVDYELITINNELPADPDVEARVQYWADVVAPLVEQVVGHTNIDLVRDYNR